MDGNERLCWLATAVFLEITGASAPDDIGTSYIVVGEAKGRDGRKLFARSAIFGFDYNPVAVAHQLDHDRLRRSCAAVPLLYG